MNCLKASVFIATSLDGYIAKEDGSLDWLDAANASVPEGEDCGYAAFMNSVDALVMGRKTYEKVRSFGSWSYGEKTVVVLSRKDLEIPADLSKSVSHSSEDPKSLCSRMAESGMKRLYIDGGITIQRFLAEGLITDLTITVIPIVLGSGIPLFGRLSKDVPLKHISTKGYDFGFVQSTYEVLA
jgi:dihydrofolate reductase